MIARTIYLPNTKIGELLFLKETPPRGYKRRGMFLCRCGKKFETDINHARRRESKSCGCLGIEARRKAVLKHGNCANFETTKEYRAWASMRARCLVKDHAFYPNYGGRGITVCKRWANSFSKFLSDMGNSPSPKHSIERVNNDKGYYPSNCIWGTKMQQLMNRRNTKLYEYNGKKQHLAAWAAELSFDKRTLWGRINKHKWSIEKTLTTPTMHTGRNIKTNKRMFA